jgi:hypothetical protein
MAAVIKAADSATTTAYVDTVSTQPLLARMPTAGAVASTDLERLVRHHRMAAGRTALASC